MRRFILICFLLLFGLLPLQAQESSIVDILLQSASAEDPEFTILLLLIYEADPEILETLTEPNSSLTFFAPTDTALIEYMDSNALTIQDLIGDTEALSAILQYHLIGESLSTAQLSATERLSPFLADTLIEVSVLRGATRLNNSATLLVENVVANNGIIHVIDRLLLPTVMAAEGTPEATEEN